MPKEIVLTRKTMGTCIQFLKQLIEGNSSHQYFRNKKPLGKLVVDELSSLLFKHSGGFVSVHSFAKTNPKSNTLIHVSTNRHNAFVLHEGDVLYLFGGKKIIVDRKSSNIFSCYTLQPRIYRDVCVIKQL